MMNAHTSANATENHTPSSLKNIGRISTAASWNTSVRRNDTAAEIAPLFSAVKNDEHQMLKPESRNVNENSLNACTVISNSSLSYPTKIPASTGARSSARETMITPPMSIEPYS